jgi:predicted AAA+ superfamily ATPase
MHPFLPEELGPRFDLSRALQHGTLPLIWSAPDRAERLLAYAHLYLKEEVQAEALVRNLPGFARFLPVAALFHGQVLNVSNIAREAGVARTTVVGYLDILEETLLTFRVPAYEARLRVRERRLPKLYWTDPGLVRAVKRQTGPVHEEERGPLFEGVVAQYLRAALDYYRAADGLYYWAPSQGANQEVDFLLQGGSRFVAIEAKSSRNFSDAWCRGLRALKDLPGLVRRIIVVPEGEPLATPDAIEVMPFSQLVALVRAGKLFG